MEELVKTIDKKISAAFEAFESRMSQVDEYYEDEGALQYEGSEPGVSEISDLDGLMAASMKNVAGVSNEENDIWQNFSSEYQADETPGKPVNEGISRMVNTMFKKKVNEDTMVQKFKTFLRPANCESLITPRVNSCIWDRLTPEIRSFDVKMQKIQNCLQKSSIAVIETLDSLTEQAGKTDDQVHALNKKLVACLAFNSYANSELNMRRRDLIKPELKQGFKHLCSPQVPVTEELFGDELHKHVKDISETQRVVGKIYRGRPFNRGYGSGFRGQPGYGRSWRGRSRYQPYYKNYGGQNQSSQGQEKNNAKNTKQKSA